MISSSHVELNGVAYKANDIELIYEPGLVQQAAIAGSSRPSTAARPDEPKWVWDDWAYGEGQKFVDSSDDLSFRRYFESNAGVDISTPGQVSLGLLLSDDVPGFSGSAIMTEGPFLAVTNGYLAAIGTDTTGAGTHRARRKALATGTWSDLGTGGTADTRISGQIHSLGTYVFIGLRNASANLRRIDVSANTNETYVSSVSESPLPADNRLYYAVDATGKLDLRQVALSGTPPLTATVVYTADGIGAQAGLTNIGHRIYVATANTDENVKLHRYDGISGVEFAQLPDGFRMDTAPYNGIQSHGNILFVAGYRDGATGEPETPMLVYATDETVGTAALIREGTSNRLLSLLAAPDDQLLAGALNGEVFAFDLTTGALSQLMSGVSSERVVSIAYAKGRYYVATRTADSNASGTGKVYSTVASGSNKHPASAAITGSKWDFNYPQEQKILLDVELHFAALAAGEKIAFAFSADDGSDVTTDSTGSTMEATFAGDGAITRKSFTISDADTERAFRYLQPKVTLTAGTNQATTPILYSATMRCRAAAKRKKYRLNLDVADQASTSRIPASALSAAKQIDTIADLIDDSANRIVQFKPYALESGPRNRTATTYNCMIVEARVSQKSKEAFLELVVL